MRPAVSRVQWILSSTVAKETERQDHLLHRGGDDGPGEDGLSVPESGSWVDSNLCFVVLISVGVGPQTSVCMELRQQQDREQVKEVPVQGGSDPGEASWGAGVRKVSSPTTGDHPSWTGSVIVATETGPAAAGSCGCGTISAATCMTVPASRRRPRFFRAQEEATSSGARQCFSHSPLSGPACEEWEPLA
ncbi:uncharacterized protein LOC117807895 isoform X2 [Notolabrus celidotus]|uniref:uncharacterized protein LOC117807895 isoform X2 n=1 Tax=Notolabrus celidotus TaxID=1203425 RepID=UPI00148F8327|nr:uncharacterized protein LOC117807895 isoform X2 [Notolabrus celidotus]